MKTLIFNFLFLGISFGLLAQSPWEENDPGSKTGEIYRSGPVGIGTFSTPDAPNWPLFPLHLVGFQESSDGGSQAPRIQLEHSYLTSSGSSGEPNENNGPSSAIDGVERHLVGWGVENLNGILKFIRNGETKVEIGSTKFLVGNANTSCDLQLFGNATFGHPAGGDRMDIFSDVYFHNATSFAGIVTFNDKLVIGNEYSGNSAFELSVDGNILCQEVTVETVEQWNDKVFSPEYELRELDDLKRFIENNRHLPEIPSEEIIKAQGYNLAEMDALLLKKIEELTLYILSLNEN